MRSPDQDPHLAYPQQGYIEFGLEAFYDRHDHRSGGFHIQI